ncbi:Major facilitator super domain-containing protein 8 [Clonorchis sinensis]|uniref:MFS transporter ceroid-lipofuscinosis neuronal protein 7 n=2 Tax=Clonorchis sinensis TaxID=79923 RepID=H2KSS2_CLOSI|nr:Major facilitator super domain-containing protein 8 [Clonorchis sinensis]GAA43104.1 MFS transporter ceroid-lipofuscinosis neuronal protein 7 [Clonorchis sinensis]
MPVADAHSCPTQEQLGEAKPRHQRQVSDVSISSIPEAITSNIPTSNGKSLIRRCCISCRQAMWSHKVWMCFTASTWGFLSSVERAVILPTLWLYLKGYWGLEAATMYYGVTMAAFSLSILVMTPVYGWASYAGIRVKTLLLLANLLEIIGNTIYLFAGSPMAVLIGRLISGIGASCEPPLYADIVRATHRDERTTYIIILLLTRQIGLIFGPSFTLMMDKMDYHVANITVSVYNGPGLLMAILWIIHSLVIIVSYPNVDKNGRLVVAEGTSGCRALCDPRYWFDNTGSSEDVQPMLVEKQDITSTRLGVQIRGVSLKTYCTYPILSLYAVTFATYFCFMGLEAVLPPVANRIFGWSEVQTSYVYLAASVLIIFVVIVLRILNSFYTDRVLLLSGLIIMVLSYLWLSTVVYFLPNMDKALGVTLLLIGIAIHVVGLPFAFAYSESLYTKVAPVADMDRAQSIFRTVLNVAFLIGPYVGGTLINTPALVFISMSLISLLPMLLVMYRFHEFNVSDRPLVSSDMDVEVAKES